MAMKAEEIQVKVTLDEDQLEYLHKLERTVTALSVVLDKAASTARIAAIKLHQFVENLESQK